MSYHSELTFEPAAQSYIREFVNFDRLTSEEQERRLPNIKNRSRAALRAVTAALYDWLPDWHGRGAARIWRMVGSCEAAEVLRTLLVAEPDPAELYDLVYNRMSEALRCNDAPAHQAGNACLRYMVSRLLSRVESAPERVEAATTSEGYLASYVPDPKSYLVRYEPTRILVSPYTYISLYATHPETKERLVLADDSLAGVRVPLRVVTPR